MGTSPGRKGACLHQCGGCPGRSCLIPHEASQASFSQNSRLYFSEQKEAFCSLANRTFQSQMWRGQIWEWWRGTFENGMGQRWKAKQGRCWFCLLRCPIIWSITGVCSKSVMPSCWVNAWGHALDIICCMFHWKTIKVFPHYIWSASLQKEWQFSFQSEANYQKSLCYWNCTDVSFQRWHFALKRVSECLLKPLVKRTLAGWPEGRHCPCLVQTKTEKGFWS